MVVQRKLSDDPTVVTVHDRRWEKLVGLRGLIDKAPLALYRNRPPTIFSPQWIPDLVVRRVREGATDVVNIHWVGHGFPRIETGAVSNDRRS